MNRREFLKFLSLGFFLPSYYTIFPKDYSIRAWTGDSYAKAHAIWEGKKPKPLIKIEAFYDVVILGAGISGLAAGFSLRDENILILEKENSTGGNAKSGNYKGIEYAQGAAYFADVEDPYGRLYGDLNLSVKPVPKPSDRWLYHGKWISEYYEDFAKDKVPKELSKDLRKFKSELQKIAVGGDFPGTPFEKSTTAAKKLDEISFAHWLRGYHPALLELLDTYCLSSMGAHPSQFSAYLGINFYSEILWNIYAFPGGNAFIAKRLTEEIERAGKNRIQKNATVCSIQPKEDKVVIGYIQNEENHFIEAKVAISAMPYFFLPYIIENLRKERGNSLKGLNYACYLVANICFDEVIFTGGFEHWIPNPEIFTPLETFSIRYPTSNWSLPLTGFTDFVIADWVVDQNKTVGEKKPYVLTLYAPYPEPKLGRLELLEGNREKIAEKIIAALEKLIPGSKNKIREIRLTRWGHPLIIPKIGFITRELPKLKKPLGRLLFAHSDGQGMPAIESALWEGLKAAKMAKEEL